jgi:hypothetical protein
MQWDDLVAAVSYYVQQEQPDGSYTAAFPTMVSNAELRIYRDFDMAATSGTNTSITTTAFNRTVDLSPMSGQTIQGTTVAYGYPVIIEEIFAKVGNRWIPYTLASLAWIDSVWPDETQAATPTLGAAYYTMLDQQTALLAPVPDGNYQLRIAGTWRPAPMSASNPETYLGDAFPDLLFAAVMVEAMGYQRDFGAQSDDPRAALSWETRYQDVLRTAKREEALKQGLGPQYQPIPPAPMARPAPPPPG